MINTSNNMDSCVFPRGILGFFKKINAQEGCIFLSVGNQKGGSILSAPAKSCLKIRELESEKAGFIRNICAVGL